ncbi:hypothetical protein PGB90_005262 [Kerria lacca]
MIRSKLPSESLESELVKISDRSDESLEIDSLSSKSLSSTFKFNFGFFAAVLKIFFFGVVCFSVSHFSGVSVTIFVAPRFLPVNKKIKKKIRTFLQFK